MKQEITLKDIADSNNGYEQFWFEKRLFEFINEDLKFKENQAPIVIRNLYLEYAEDKVVPFIESVLGKKVKGITKENRAGYDGTFFGTFEYKDKIYYNAQSYGSCSVCDQFEEMDLQDFKNCFEIGTQYDSLEELKQDLDSGDLDDGERALVGEQDNE